MNHRAVNLVVFVLVAFYTICSITLISLGISAYKNVRSKDDSANTMRVSMGYIENKLRSSDISNAVSIEERNGIDTLVLKYEGGNDCETLVYFLDGALYEMFKFTDFDIDPRYGMKLCCLESFEMDLSNGVLHFSVADENGNKSSIVYTLACAKGGR